MVRASLHLHLGPPCFLPRSGHGWHALLFGHVATTWEETSLLLGIRFSLAVSCLHSWQEPLAAGQQAPPSLSPVGGAEPGILSRAWGFLQEPGLVGSACGEHPQVHPILRGHWGLCSLLIPSSWGPGQPSPLQPPWGSLCRGPGRGSRQGRGLPGRRRNSSAALGGAGGGHALSTRPDPPPPRPSRPLRQQPWCLPGRGICSG